MVLLRLLSVYAIILGLTQVVGATLLLFRKTTLLGALVPLSFLISGPPKTENPQALCAFTGLSPEP
jgi:hypothetical protein